ncbi:FAD:protein FMN transferase [Microvirga sp. BT689]|uniref:FAD:protein FMN transferase n=1 Tax=Microvirga arvi TaxID=2778731 RepID=UPI001950CA3C|nr:FAD:protein FMN transferase [Microvirga arvi]MBM6582227.1 FAD:protein FMN transferase [Microvirga arvi]
MFRFTFNAIGTTWEIETPSPLEMPARRRILERFDATYSRFRPDSLVSRIASLTEGGCVTFPEEAVALFDLYDRLHACTEGAVDPLVGVIWNCSAMTKPTR